MSSIAHSTTGGSSLPCAALAMSKKIAERLIELRGKVSLAEIAKVAGVSSATTVSNWENWQSEAHSMPPADVVAKLAQHWKVSADFIVGLSDFRTGLAPDSWLVHLDDYEAGVAGEKWAVKVPRRHRIVDYDGLQELKRTAPKAKGKGKGKGGEDGVC
jgi:transcriptional regulator with XRE-family HTH domain